MYMYKYWKMSKIFANSKIQLFGCKHLWIWYHIKEKLNFHQIKTTCMCYIKPSLLIGSSPQFNFFSLHVFNYISMFTNSKNIFFFNFRRVIQPDPDLMDSLLNFSEDEVLIYLLSITCLWLLQVLWFLHKNLVWIFFFHRFFLETSLHILCEVGDNGCRVGLKT